MLEQIREWLNGNREYSSGVALVLRHSTDPRIINCFREPLETNFKRKKLVEVLTELYTDRPEPAALRAPSQPALPPAEKTWPVDNTNEILASLREQWRPLYGEMTNYQARIHDIALQGVHDPQKKEEAHQMAKKIIDLNNKVNEIYARKAYFLKFGKLPDDTAEPIKEISSDTAFMRKKTVERYLRDLAAKLKRTELSDVKRTKWIPKWDSLCEELRALNKTLNRAENEGIPER